MSIDDILQSEAAHLEREFADHDPVAFTRRLAERIAAQEPPSPERQTTRSERAPASARPPASPPRESHGRLRTTPVTAAPTRQDLRNDLRRLCQDVFSSEQLEHLAKFADQCDEVGARTFGCLLYCLNRHDEALFWWRFAAGAGDRLAAHCLAVHHAADGTLTDARLWRAVAHTMGFDASQLPTPADTEPVLPTDVARSLTDELSDPAPGTATAVAVEAFVTEPTQPATPPPPPSAPSGTRARARVIRPGVPRPPKSPRSTAPARR